MLFRLLGRLVWGTSKFTVRRILVPIAVTAITAVVLSELADRIRDDKAPNGAERSRPRAIAKPKKA